MDLLSGFLLFLYMSTLANVYKEDCSFFLDILLPYSIGKVKPFEEIEEREPIDININLFAKKEEE